MGLRDLIANTRPEKQITYAWVLCLIFVFAFCICAIAMAANNDAAGEYHSKSHGFAVIWSMLLVILLSVGGTLVMQRFRTPLAVGFLLGVTVMMSINMFSLCILFAGAAHYIRDPKDPAKSSDEAAAAFAFFLFLSYGAFSVVLALHRNQMLENAKERSMSSMDGNVEATDDATHQAEDMATPPPVSV